VRLARTVGVVGVVAVGIAGLIATTLPAGASTVSAPRGALTATTESTAAAPYRLATTTLSNGKRVHPRWNRCQKAVVYRVNVKYAAKTKKGRASALKDVKTAMAKVSSATGITFRYAGTSTIVPRKNKYGLVRVSSPKQSAELLVAWSKQSRSDGRTNLVSSNHGVGGFRTADGVTSKGVRGSVITSGYVNLASERMSLYKPGFGKGMTRGTVLLHELGHAVGLEHVNDRSQLMNPVFVKRTTKTAYAKGDLAGLNAVGRGAACLRVR